MTKLRKKLKVMARKKAHRVSVHKRKVDRLERESEERGLAEEQRRKSQEDRDVWLLTADPLENQGATPNSSNTVMSDRKAANLLGGLIVQKLQKKSKKKLSRKQLKRKEKIVDRGEAIAGALDKKWSLKKIRVKARAQTRNEGLE